MNIVEPSFSILTPFGPLTPEMGKQMLQFIERNARISHKSEEAQTDDSWQRFIPAVVLQHGDWSVAEHVSITVILRTDRGITHELVRHRLFSFTQESTRFVNGAKSYPDGLEFIKPLGIPDPEKFITDRNFYRWRTSVQVAEDRYLEMLKDGIRPQEARSILPNCLASTISMTGNLRSWRWFLLARTTKQSHPDMRRLTIPLLKQFQEFIPLLFNDIAPEESQSISMAKLH